MKGQKKLLNIRGNFKWKKVLATIICKSIDDNDTESIRLYNIHKRVKLLYGEEYRIGISSEEDKSP